jgi:hypothetical protein
MLPGYKDIRARIPETPRWFDRHGVPRYDDFTPRSCGVYAHAVALVEVACQACGQRFLVAVDYDRLELHDMMRVGEPLDGLYPTVGNIRAFHYGDPPSHGCVGDTMNVVSVRVVQFWVSPSYVDDDTEWRRVAAHEVQIEADPDNPSFANFSV